MILSARRPDGTYVYYQAAKHPGRAKGPRPGAIGLGVEQAVPTCPWGAKRVGSGRRARGVVCRQGGLAGLGDLAGMSGPIAGILLTAALFGAVWLAGPILSGR